MPSIFLIVSWTIVGIVVFMALFWRWIMPYDPNEQDLLNTSAPPSSEHWLGTDQLGRDIFARIIAGAPAAITGPLVVALTGVILASSLGILSGYMGGHVDMVIQRFVDFMFALPGLLIAIVIVGVVGGGYWMARARAQPAQLRRQRPHPPRCRAGAAGSARTSRPRATLGVPRHRIMYFHIWRNISPIVFASAALDFALALVALSSLSYLGLGTSPGVPEWGRMLAENQALLFTNPAGVLAPGLAIVLFATAVDGDRRLDLRPLLATAAERVADVAAAEQLLAVRGLRVEYVGGRRAPARSSTASTSTSRRGETIAIVGESGSGKSLTARAIIAPAPDRRRGDRRRGRCSDGSDVLRLRGREAARLRGDQHRR